MNEKCNELKTKHLESHSVQRMDRRMRPKKQLKNRCRDKEEPEECCAFEATKERISRHNKWSAISHKIDKKYMNWRYGSH